MKRFVVAVWAVLLLACAAPAAAGSSPAFDFTIITSAEAEFAERKIVPGIRRILGGGEVRRLAVDEPEGRRLADELKMDAVPYVVFPETIVRHPKFFELARSGRIDRVAGRYVIPAKFLRSAGAVLFRRDRKNNHLDLFITSHCNRGKTAFRQVDDYLSKNPGAFSLTARYITEFRDFGIDSAYGPKEIREDIRQIVLQRFYPDALLPYHRLYRAGEAFDAILPKIGVSLEEIRSRQQEGISLLRKDFELSRELGVKESPAFLWENRVLLQGLSGFRGFVREWERRERAENRSEGEVSADPVKMKGDRARVEVFFSPD